MWNEERGSDQCNHLRGAKCNATMVLHASWYIMIYTWYPLSNTYGINGRRASGTFSNVTQKTYLRRKHPIGSSVYMHTHTPRCTCKYYMNIQQVEAIWFPMHAEHPRQAICIWYTYIQFGTTCQLKIVEIINVMQNILDYFWCMACHKQLRIYLCLRSNVIQNMPTNVQDKKTKHELI